MNTTLILAGLAALGAFATYYYRTKSKVEAITNVADSKDAALKAEEKPVPAVVAGPVPTLPPPATDANAEAANWTKELAKEEG